MLPIDTSPQAERDLAELADYSVQQFGWQKANDYVAQIVDSFHLLAANPYAGTDQSGIKPGIRRFVRSRHAIYYRVAEDVLVILRVLGPGQDPYGAFQ